MSRYTQATSVPQTQQQDPNQIKNRAGGYGFGVDCWQQLDRFLILGAEGNTYYAGEREQVFENAANVRKCIAEDGARAVARIAEISDAGRAPKNEPAIFALSVAAADKNPETRKLALAALPKVCRTSTHLFHWIEDVKKMRGFGPQLRRAVSDWYNSKNADQVAYQAVKYQQRDGWSHSNILELAHPKASTPEHNAVFRYIAGGMDAFENYKHRPTAKVSAADLPKIVHGFEMAKKCDSVKELVRLIRDYRLPHECVPNDFKDKPEVWAAMLPSMGITAVIRNLGKLTNIGLLGKDRDITMTVANMLQDTETLKRGRVHPISILLAMSTYKMGHGLKGKLSWTPVTQIVDALDGGFYASFDAVEPTGKRFMLNLDVSGSMGSSYVTGTTISAREAAAAMAMSIMRVEKDVQVFGFSNGKTTCRYIGDNSHNGITPLDISPRRRLDDIVRYVSNLPFGGTDCALPFQYARENNMDFDVVMTLTDNETWAGPVHPHVALETYRHKRVRDCRFIACAFTATNYSVADSTDPMSINAVGLDSNLPAVVQSFARGEF